MYPIMHLCLNFASQVDFAALPLATLASYHARDYRDALNRRRADGRSASTGFPYPAVPIARTD